MLNITKGKEIRAKKIVVYGPEGIGKSTFASEFPNPLFIDTEGGTSNLDVRRIKCNKSWDELLNIVKEVKVTPDVCKTLVIDTADWAETLCTNAVCDKYRKANIEDFGYGKGYTYLQDEFGKLLKALDELIEVGINVVVTAHAKPRKFELPEEQGAFDKWEMKLTKQVAPLLKEWCDALFFCNYKIYVVATESGRMKAQGGKRVLYTSHNPTYDAKNRFNLPEELELDFSSIACLFDVEKTVIPAIEEDEAIIIDRPIVENLKQRIIDSEITQEQLQEVVAGRGHYGKDTQIDDYSDQFITRWIIPNWKKIVQIIKANNTNKGDK